MNYSSMYGVPEKGNIGCLKEYNNSFCAKSQEETLPSEPDLKERLTKSYESNVRLVKENTYLQMEIWRQEKKIKELEETRNHKSVEGLRG
ncbi:hypothetical protein N9948_00710 [bacterium]|nr:hypothetical protein [bacterium]